MKISFTLLLIIHLASCSSNDASSHPDKLIEKTQIACPTKATVIVTFGQSNAGNNGETKKISTNRNIVNFYKGKCYIASDPLLGADGDKGSPWVRMSESLINSGALQSIVIAPIAANSSNIESWSNGKNKERLTSIMQQLKESNLLATHFLWHQGEPDAHKTTTTEYQSSLEKIINLTRSSYPQSKFFVSVASGCEMSWPDHEIQKAQINSLNIKKNIFAGPNTDNLPSERVSSENKTYRFDGCHFSDQGLIKVAELWAIAIKQSNY